jgi:hypothetical protein
VKLTYPLLLNAKPQNKPYKIRDRDSMYLRVSVSGSKVWKYDYRLDGKDCSYTLGRFPDLSIMRANNTRKQRELKQLDLLLSSDQAELSPGFPRHLFEPAVP